MGCCHSKLGTLLAANGAWFSLAFYVFTFRGHAFLKRHTLFKTVPDSTVEATRFLGAMNAAPAFLALRLLMRLSKRRKWAEPLPTEMWTLAIANFSQFAVDLWAYYRCIVSEHFWPILLGDFLLFVLDAYVACQLTGSWKQVFRGIKAKQAERLALTSPAGACPVSGKTDGVCPGAAMSLRGQQKKQQKIHRKDAVAPLYPGVARAALETAQDAMTAALGQVKLGVSSVLRGKAVHPGAARAALNAANAAAAESASGSGETKAAFGAGSTGVVPEFGSISIVSSQTGTVDSVAAAAHAAGLAVVGAGVGAYGYSTTTGGTALNSALLYGHAGSGNTRSSEAGARGSSSSSSGQDQGQGTGISTGSASSLGAGSTGQIKPAPSPSGLSSGSSSGKGTGATSGDDKDTAAEDDAEDQEDDNAAAENEEENDDGDESQGGSSSGKKGKKGSKGGQGQDDDEEADAGENEDEEQGQEEDEEQSGSGSASKGGKGQAGKSGSQGKSSSGASGKESKRGGSAKSGTAGPGQGQGRGGRRGKGRRGAGPTDEEDPEFQGKKNLRHVDAPKTPKRKKGYQGPGGVEYLSPNDPTRSVPAIVQKIETGEMFSAKDE